MARKTVKVFNVTDDDLKNLSEYNKYLINDFINYCKAENKAKKTIKVYQSNLNIFFVWFEKNCKVKGKQKHISQFKAKDLIAFQSYMLQEGLSSSRISNLRASVSSLFNYIENILAEDEDYEEFKNFRNCISKVKAPKAEKVRKKTILSDDQCQWLLDKLVEENKIQMACVFALAWASGRRKVELLEFKVSHFVDENIKFCALYKTPELQTKGKKLELYVIKSKFKPYFDLWMNERKRLGVPDNVDDLFIRYVDGEWKLMKESNLNYYAEMISKYLECDFYFHCVRHNFTTSLLEQGLPESAVQMILGWSDISMVGIYDDRDKDDMIGEYFNENGIVTKKSKSLSEL